MTKTPRALIVDDDPGFLEGLAELVRREGFAVSTGETDGTQNLHILLTNSIRQGGQPIAVGISPGIPGAGR